MSKVLETHDKDQNYEQWTRNKELKKHEKIHGLPFPIWILFEGR
jgi:hypothetical protein